MFQATTRADYAELLDHEPLAVVPVRSVPAADTPVAQTSRYGQARPVNLPAIIAILILHAVAVFAIMQVRHHSIAHKEASLSVVNLTPPPPPPPAAETQPPPAQAQVVAPPPLVHIPQPSIPQVVTTPDPVPVPTPVVAAPSPITAAVSAAVSAPPSTVQSSDLSSRMLSGKPPRYPIDSRRKHEQGTVVLSLTLGLDGRVSTISIAQSSGFARLDAAARDAVRDWRWAPMLRDGQAVMVRGLVEIPFVLQG